ncbi:hypothetical protein MNV49_002218 [Pseudohyphozyma bogoriensis]|nr:hypothetical protein MNV49_002218 [Pseudohyphozyma bogoriensis]
MSQRVVPSPSPAPDTSAEDNPPLAFDSERELDELVARLRSDLQQRCRAAWEEDGGGSQLSYQKTEDLVLKDFFDEVAPMLCSNCTIAGIPYAKYKRGDAIGDTAPFSEDLHERVVRYQNQLFDARVHNIEQRKAISDQMAAGLTGLIDSHNQALAKLEQPFDLNFPPKAVAPPAKGRKSVSGKREEGPDAQEAQESFLAGKAHIDRLLVDVPELSHKADKATQVSKDVGALSAA